VSTRPACLSLGTDAPSDRSPWLASWLTIYPLTLDRPLFLFGHVDLERNSERAGAHVISEPNHSARVLDSNQGTLEIDPAAADEPLTSHN
jgi:hypothetical protein